MAKRISSTGITEFLYQFQTVEGMAYSVWATSKVEAARLLREAFSN